jgi:hypothetical protein
MDTLTRIKIYQAYKAGYLKNVTKPIQQNDKQRAEYHAAAYVTKLKTTK